MVKSGNKHYFISDLHLGTGNSRQREQRFVRWLDFVKHDAEAIYLLGDIFDFWFEYHNVIPKGFTRAQGKIAELTDRGIAVHWFLGNHDMWIFDYMTTELGVVVHRHNLRLTIQGKNVFMGHGDGLGPGDTRYKFIKRAFSCKINQALFAFLHPRIGIGLGNYFSRKSRLENLKDTDNEAYDDTLPINPQKEMLIHYCEKVLKEEPIDYFIFGHRHRVIDHTLSNGSRYINTGEWVYHSHYAVMEDGRLSLKTFS